MRIQVCPSSPKGTLKLPPSKSMAHRLLICAALANGTSLLSGLSHSEDIRATARALSALGATVKLSDDGNAEVHGVKPDCKMWTPKTDADCAESGSTLRFMIPLFALCAQKQQLSGAERLFERPLHVYQELFKNQNLDFGVNQSHVSFQGPLQAGEFIVAGNVSSQFISGLLFALPLLEKDSVLHITPPFESRDYVELTRSAQAQFGVKSYWKTPHELHIPAGQTYRPCTAAVEGDWSQAAVPAVLGAVLGPLNLTGLKEDSMQGDRVILEILRRCGADIGLEKGVYTIAPGAQPLRAAGRIDLANCPDLGPILCVLALFCSGVTEIYNAGRLRAKESDRIASMEKEISKLGGRITTTQDSIRIEGGQALQSAVTYSHNDHRVVMALSVLSVCAGLDVTIDGAEAISKSWPTFFDDLRELEINVEEV